MGPNRTTQCLLKWFHLSIEWPLQPKSIQRKLVSPIPFDNLNGDFDQQKKGAMKPRTLSQISLLLFAFLNTTYIEASQLFSIIKGSIRQSVGTLRLSRPHLSNLIVEKKQGNSSSKKRKNHKKAEEAAAACISVLAISDQGGKILAWVEEKLATSL